MSPRSRVAERRACWIQIEYVIKIRRQIVFRHVVSGAHARARALVRLKKRVVVGVASDKTAPIATARVEFKMATRLLVRQPSIERHSFACRTAAIAHLRYLSACVCVCVCMSTRAQYSANIRRGRKEARAARARRLSSRARVIDHRRQRRRRQRRRATLSRPLLLLVRANFASDAIIIILCALVRARTRN